MYKIYLINYCVIQKAKAELSKRAGFLVVFEKVFKSVSKQMYIQIVKRFTLCHI